MFPISDSIKSRFPILNILIIVFTSYIFFKEIISSSPDLFIQTYALVPSMVNFSNIETLFPFATAIFLHGGFLHILSNMWFLWIFGDNIEDYFGSLFYLFLYFISGITGNFVQYLLMPNSSIPILGASGAIAGVLGAYFVLFTRSRVKTIVPIFFYITILDIPAPFMLGYWFVLQFIAGVATLPFSGDSGGVAFFAHVGGFITGMIIALFIKVLK